MILKSTAKNTNLICGVGMHEGQAADLIQTAKGKKSIARMESAARRSLPGWYDTRQTFDGAAVKLR